MVPSFEEAQRFERALKTQTFTSTLCYKHLEQSLYLCLGFQNVRLPAKDAVVLIHSALIKANGDIASPDGISSA